LRTDRGSPQPPRHARFVRTCQVAGFVVVDSSGCACQSGCGKAESWCFLRAPRPWQVCPKTPTSESSRTWPSPKRAPCRPGTRRWSGAGQCRFLRALLMARPEHEHHDGLRRRIVMLPGGGADRVAWFCSPQFDWNAEHTARQWAARRKNIAMYKMRVSAVGHQQARPWVPRGTSRSRGFVWSLHQSRRAMRVSKRTTWLSLPPA
jgi:hypothetical protein